MTRHHTVTNLRSKPSGEIILACAVDDHPGRLVHDDNMGIEKEELQRRSQFPRSTSWNDAELVSSVDRRLAASKHELSFATRKNFDRVRASATSASLLGGR